LAEPEQNPGIAVLAVVEGDAAAELVAEAAVVG
jgi:hypothetical protein